MMSYPQNQTQNKKVFHNNSDQSFEEYLTDRKDVGRDILAKYGFILFQVFQYMHNFKYKVILEDKWFGDAYGGIDGGIAFLLYTKQIEMSMIVGIPKIARIQFIDFVMPSYIFSTSFLFRNPGLHNMWENEFLKPFTLRTWIVILVIGILISGCIKIAYWAEYKFMNSHRNYSVFTSILITLSVICQQGSSIFPDRFTGRFIFFLLLVFSTILYNYYTSSIVSSLLSSTPTVLSTFKDLLRSGLEVGMQDAPYTRTIFATTDDTDILAIGSKIFPKGQKPHIYDPHEGIEMINKGGFAYHMPNDEAYLQISRMFDLETICDLAGINLIPDTQAFFLMTKNGQYKNVFEVRKMEESGIISRNRQIWQHKKPPCLANAIILSVGMDQTFLAFLFLFVGYSISVIVMFLEIYSI